MYLIFLRAFEILKTYTMSWKWFATCCLEKYLLLFACIWLVWLGFLTELTGSFGMLMNSEVAKQARRATLFFSFWDKIMTFYQLEKKSSQPGAIRHMEILVHMGPFWKRKSEPSFLLTPQTVYWPIPDWRPISHVWPESTHCIGGLEGDVWASDLLFVSDNSQNLFPLRIK